ncbi:MAG: hypothetical protein V3V00_16555 [Saprospiraceae bacterium]
MFISKIKDLTRFKKPLNNLLDITILQDQLCNGLYGVMDKSFANRKKDIVNTNYTVEDIDNILSGYAKKNMILAAASSIVPGPLGILGAVPELILNFGNQMYMIYDLGCAYDKESFINKDILLDIPFAAFGGNTKLGDIQSYSADLLDAPQKVLLEKAKTLGGSILEKTLKKSIVQFIPVAGPLLMSIWAKKTTAKIAGISNNFLDQGVEYVEHVKKEETEEVKTQLQIEKIKGLANLIEANNEINEDQIAFIGPIIENANISQNEKNHLLEESLKVDSNFQLDYQLLRDYEEDDDLITELIIMAKRSGNIDHLEREYIYTVAQDLSFKKSMVDDLLEE